MCTYSRKLSVNILVCVCSWLMSGNSFISCSSGNISCGISVSNGLLAIKVENVSEVWTVDTSVFDVITFTSSPGLRRHPLPQSYSRSVSIAFKNANVAFPTGIHMYVSHPHTATLYRKLLAWCTQVLGFASAPALKLLGCCYWFSKTFSEDIAVIKALVLEF